MESIENIIICSRFLSAFFVIIKNTAFLIILLYQKNSAHSKSSGKYRDFVYSLHIESILKSLEIEDKKEIRVCDLSGGQQQRVAIARAIVNSPEIILADEPTGALDQETGREVMEIFSKLNQQGKTIIIVTHDPNIAAKCNRIVKMVDGKIQE